MWNYVDNKENKQWIWMVLDVKSSQMLAFHVGDRSKNSAAMLMEKLPGELKKNYFFTQIISPFIPKSLPKNNIVLLAKDQEKQITLKDLTALLDNDVQG